MLRDCSCSWQCVLQPVSCITYEASACKQYPFCWLSTQQYMPAIAHPPALYLPTCMHAGIGATSTGHCHPHVVKAVQEQAAKIVHAQQNVLAGHTKRVGVMSLQQRVCVSTEGQVH